MTWEIKYNNIKKFFSDFGITDLNRKRFNQGPDTVTINCFVTDFMNGSNNKSDYDNYDPASFEAGSTLEVYFKNKRWFSGVVTKTPDYAYKGNENQSYEVKGPWWYLENLVYQQGWANAKKLDDGEIDIEFIDTGRVILGQDREGKRLSNGDQIKKILSYAAENGAPIAVGEIEVDTDFPTDEVKDISCAEAINRLLRWSPDAVFWVDYDVEGFPRIHIKKQRSLPKYDVEVGKSSLKKLVISRRCDLQIPSVVIKYEKTHIIDGRSWSTTEVDCYPEGTTGRELKAMVLTVELQGARARHIKQDVKTKLIEPESAEWWQSHLPALRNIPLEKISVSNPERKSNLLFALTEGSISEWMEKQVEEDVIRASISYSTDNETIIDREVAVKIHATNAKSNSYEHRVNSIQEEDTPKGLAKKLYDAVKELQYEGEVILLNDEITPEISLGKRILIQSDSHKWRSFEAVIQCIQEDVASGETLIKFGPAKHLGVDDMVELLRMNRVRKPAKNAFRRKTARSSMVEVLEQPTHGKLENSHEGPGKLGKLVFENSKKPERKIVLDAESITKDAVIEFKEEDVCENGVLKKRFVLASQPYERGENE